MRGTALNYILLIVLVLMIFGIVSLGDVVSVIAYIFVGFLVLVLAGVLYFRYRVSRMRKQVNEQQEAYRRSAGRRQNGGQSRPEGEVTVERKASQTRVVRSEVGDYVEYEDIDEEFSAEDNNK